MARVLDISSLTFVYPFSFETGEFSKLVSKVENAGFGTGSSQKFWNIGSFPHRELLPHISSYLTHDSGKESTGRLWKINDGAMSSYDGLGSHADWCLKYTRKDDNAPENAPGEKFEIPFCFLNVQLFLFRAGIGMLAITVQPQTDSLEKWQDFSAYFRKFYSKRPKLSAKRTKGREIVENFFPSFTPDGKKSESGSLSEIIEGLLKTVDKKDWWQNVFIESQTLPFTTFFITDHPQQNDYRLLYKLRNFFHSKQGNNPAPTDLLPNHPALLEYSERQWFTFALDGGNFLACDPPDTAFFRKTLPAHIRDQYFHLYIIALHQRFCLMDMSHNVAEHWWTENEGERMKAFEHIRDRFLAFTARGYFAQVMQREHHHRNYRKWQETFELQRLYDEVREEIREMFEWLQLKATQEASRRATQFERRISTFGLLIALGIGIPALVVGFFGMNITDMPANFNLTFRNAVFLLLGTIIICVLIAVAIYFFMNRNTESTQSNNENQNRDDKFNHPEK